MVDLFKKLERRPRYPFMLIGILQLSFGAIVFFLGLSAFNTTPQYRVGGFWAGLIVFGCGVYRITLLVLRIVNNARANTHKAKLTIIMIALNCVCLVAFICAFLTDSIGAFLLQQVNFQFCSHTRQSITSPCDKIECSAIRFPQNTCFCCHIMEGIKSSCQVSLLTGRQYYYTEVESCAEIAVGLRIKLILLTILHTTNAIICIAGIFITSPIAKPTSDESVKFSSLAKTKKKKAGTKRGGLRKNEESEMSEEEELLSERMKKVMNSISDNSVL